MIRKKYLHMTKQCDNLINHSLEIKAQHSPIAIKNLSLERMNRKISISPRQSTEETESALCHKLEMQKLLIIEKQWDSIKTQLNRSLDSTRSQADNNPQYSKLNLLLELTQKHTTQESNMDEIPNENIGVQCVKQFKTSNGCAFKRANTTPRNALPRNNGIYMKARQSNNTLLIKAMEANSSIGKSKQTTVYHSCSERMKKCVVNKEGHVNKPITSLKFLSKNSQPVKSSECIDNYYVCGGSKANGGTNCSYTRYPYE